MYVTMQMTNCKRCNKFLYFSMQMHYRFSPSRTLALRISDRPRKDYLFGAFRLLMARRGYFDTTIDRTAIDIPADRAS